MKYIGDFFGWIMYFCYQLVHNYGLTIILFTLLTRIVLLPVAIMVQKNSIKMVKMYPETNLIKAKNFGNKEMISEEQYALYKKYKYNPMLDIVPVIIQLVMLMGVVNVIYEPLRQLLHVDQGIIDSAINVFCNLTGKNPEVASNQVQFISYLADLYDKLNNDVATREEILAFDAIKNVIPNDAMKQIHGLDLHFLGLNLGVVPSQVGGGSIIIPLLAAFSSWLMCFTQNKSNVLQSEQSKANQIGTMIFSVALSLYLGFFVPAGVGFYWTVGNLVAIAQMYILNACINPKRYIDYEALEESRKELEKVTKYAKEAKKNRSKEEVALEKADYKRFMKFGPKQLVYYSEGQGFYKYFKEIIEYILSKTDIIIHYITSDPNDEILGKQTDNFRTYYIGSTKLIILMMKLDTDICVMTMPDLEKYQIKRSIVRDDIEYIYIDHGMASPNLVLRKHALDYFDTVFATNEYMKEEIRKMEEIYGLKEKTIVECGYTLMDTLSEVYEKEQAKKTAQETDGGAEHLAENTSAKEKKAPSILIAPSWQKDNIMDLCIDEILEQLLGQNYEITIRPHPQYVRHYKEKLMSLKEKYASYSNFTLQLDFSSNKTVYESDIMITDWSSICYEYSFVTLKPTLFINTPMKTMNPDYEELGIVPFDLELRDQMGISVDTDKLSTIPEVVHRLLHEEIYSKEGMKKVREKYVYNVGKSAGVGAKYIIKSLIAKSGH